MKDVLTEIDPASNSPKYKNDKPILMISSTSWTPDEDFGMLFNSFVKIEQILSDFEMKNKNNNIKIRKILFIITGRGPQRDFYMNKINEMNFKYFNIKSVWLNSDDYPKILGSADLGVCLHYSSSGFDLPMKVVDMFASQLPVCAVFYPTIKELVEENKNGFLFKNEDELTELLSKIIQDFSIKRDNGEINNESREFAYEEHKKINQFSLNLKDFAEYDWVKQWKEKVKKPVMTIIGIEDSEIKKKFI